MRRDATPAERRLWRVLSASGLGVRFVRQHPVRPYILDFACRPARLAVELDGGGHDWTGEYDDRRTRALEQAGWRVLRFRNEALIHDLDAVLATIRAALPAPAAAQPPLPEGRGDNRSALPPGRAARASEREGSDA